MWARLKAAFGDRRVQWTAGLLALLVFWRLFLRLPRPPEPGIVATYQGKMVTREELRRYLHEYLARCPKHLRCAQHGDDHSACLPKESCETFTDCAGDQHRLVHSLPMYRRAAESLVVDRLIGDLVAKRKLEEQKKTRHLMKHVTEEINLSGQHEEWHKGKIRVDAIEIKQYYEANRNRFGSRSLSEVSGEIEKALIERKEKAFLADYLKTLREDAGLQINYALLKYPEPDEEQLRTLYFEKRQTLRQPASAKLLLVQIPKTTGAKARQAVRQARALLISGLTPAELRKRLQADTSGVVVKEGVVVSEANELWKKAGLRRRLAGEVTDVVAIGDKLMAARVVARQESRPLQFEEVRAQLADQSRKMLRKRHLAENRSATLFTLHGEPYTLGDFMEEFDELSPLQQAQYPGYEGRKKLADMMIERALLVEASSDDIRTSENRKLVERVRRLVLKQLLHQEEVDDKIALADRELRQFFVRNQRYYRRPARVKASTIRVDIKGQSDATRKRAREKAEEALAQLKAVSKLDQQQFARVAKRFSDDPNVAKTGGKIANWIAETGDLVSELLYHQLHKNLMSLRKGELSSVFQIGDSFYIAWVWDREEESDRTFEEAKELVRQDLREFRHYELTAKLESDLVRKANARIYDYTLIQMLREESR